MTDNRVIAIEEHYASASYIAAAAKLDLGPDDGFEMQAMRGPFAGGWSERMSNIDMRLAEMDASGTDLAVLSLSPPGVQPYVPAAAATALVQTANDDIAKVVREQPDRFAGFGAVAPQDPEHASGEIARIMGPLGLSGIMICSHTDGRYLDDPFFEPLLAAAEANHSPIYLHPRMPSAQMLAAYKEYGLFGAIWGYQAEAGLHAIRLILGGVFDKHPELQLILGHLGEGLPYWLKRLDNRYAFTYASGGDRFGMVKLALTPSEYVQRNVSVTTSGMDDPEVLAFCVDRIGEDRIMFATDYPYEESAPAVAFLKSAPVTDDQRAKISHGNAERLLNIVTA